MRILGFNGEFRFYITDNAVCQEYLVPVVVGVECSFYYVTVFKLADNRTGSRRCAAYIERAAVEHDFNVAACPLIGIG